ncbi:ABC transporter ATP-binding protein [Tistrella bauzanensis]|uniref:ABC transporter ATP-binding protein n=1 Tax=Tistrella bauzanensis TaxID=657419 RepID=A0ABQ1IQC3_9PROT|nr:ABC transporter ATP-binding protein [Tistrella bauzanensis]GGB49791.1 ABC transporter ATP-binding protein [Tistrella bauzanensis]
MTIAASRSDPAGKAGDHAPPLLDIENIEVVYNHTVQVLRGLSIRVAPGAIVALLGANGAGKSTTLKTVSGLIRLENGGLTAGHIRFRGHEAWGRAPDSLVHDGLFHVMEGRRVFEDLTVEENLTAATYARKGGRRASGGDAGDPIEMVYGYFPRLKERRKGLAGYLSGGEQQMLAIGRALVADPQLIMLDEPSLGLAPMVVEEIFSIVLRINRERGTAVLLVEQNAAIALAVADYAYIMESGRVVIDGTPAELAANQDVQEFYLGHGGEDGAGRSFRDIKHYKRRKRWLS